MGVTSATLHSKRKDLAFLTASERLEGDSVRFGSNSARKVEKFLLSSFSLGGKSGYFPRNSLRAAYVTPDEVDSSL